MSSEHNHPDTRAATPLSKAQEQRLLSHVRKRAEQARRDGTSRSVVDEIIISILLQAGLKAYELRGLRIMDTPAYHGKPEVHVQERTGAISRSVQIPQDMIPAFQRFVRLYRPEASAADPFLLSERGTPFSYMSLYSKLRRIGREAGVRNLSPAVLRHTFLVRLYKKEQDLRLVQEQAGHAQLRSTARRLRPHRMASRCGACDGLLTPGTGERIDSGQVLCPTCLKDLRNR